MKILRFIVCLLFLSSASIRAAEMIGIEVKEYDNIDAFVLYHTDFLRLDVTYVSGVVKIKSDYAIKFRKLTPVSIDNLSSGLKNETSKVISFSTKEPYVSFEVVRGEKLTAIKFRTDKKFEKAQHDIRALNKQDHETSGMKVEEKLQKDKGDVKFNKTKDSIEVKFDFDEEVSCGAFQRSNKVWIAFNKKKGFEFPVSSDIKPPTLIEIPTYTVLSFEIPNGYVPSIQSSSPSSWSLNFKRSKVPLKLNYKVEKLIDAYGVHVSGDSFQNKIDFTDPVIGDEITIITSTKAEQGLSFSSNFNDFTVHNSLVGVGVSWITEDSNVDFTKNGAEIYSSSNIVLNKAAEETKLDFSKSNLPVKFDVEGKNFVEKRGNLAKELVKSSLPDQDRESKYKLACYFFNQKLYHDALGVINTIKEEENFINKYPQISLLKAVTLSIIGRYQESIEITNALSKLKLSTSLKAENSIWDNFNKVKLEDSTNSIGLLSYIDGFISTYPDDIYWILLGAEFEVLSSNNDLASVEELFRRVKDPVDQNHIDELNFYRATFYRKNQKFSLANNYYDAIKLDYSNPYQYVRSELDQVDMIIKMSQMDPDEAVKKLDKLKYLWRGDKLEYQVLLRSAELRETNHDYIKALRTYKYLLEFFPNSKGSVHISHQMGVIYNNFIFSKGGVIDGMSDFDVVSLYYEFRELTPIGNDGDKVVLSVAKRMINLDLLDEAEKILNHQVQYRLSGKDKIISGEHLGAVYLLNKKPKLALEVLNSTDIINSGFIEHLSRQRLKAKAHMDIGEYDMALDILEEDDSREAKIMRLEIYFKKSDWSNYALTAESDILPLLSVSKKIPENLEKEVLRLAISYSMLAREDDIAYLDANINTEDKVLKDSIKLISSSNEKVDITNLDNNLKSDEVEKYFRSIVDKLFDFK
jgi:tetratricopeptide (TPR) repeat protein